MSCLVNSRKTITNKINANFKNVASFNKLVADLGGSVEGQTSGTVVTETVELVAA